MNPLVSIITPTYNRQDLLPLTIQSILRQSFTDFEYLIIDDGSSDATSRIVASISDPRVSYHFQPNAGESAATNRGWRLAKGRYVAVVSSDDPVLPGWLEALVDFMERNPEILVAYPDWRLIGRSGETLNHEEAPDYSFENMVAWLRTIPGPGALIRREALADLPALRNVAYRYAPDLDTWLRLGLRGPFARLPRELATWRQHSSSISFYDRSVARAAEMPRIAKAFFAREDLPPHVHALRHFALSRAYWIASWVLENTHPLKSAIYLDRSYRTAPEDPPDLPVAMKRAPRPSPKLIPRLLAERRERIARKSAAGARN